MKKSIFTRSIRILIITLLLLTVFFQREQSQKLMVAAAALWLGCMIVFKLGKQASRLIKKGYQRLCTLKERVIQQMAQDTASGEYIPSEPMPTPIVQTYNETNPIKDEEMMLRHIALRITDKMKSAYPNATWEWKSPPSLHQILNGESIRIAVEDMADYTHADIAFDRFGRIHIEPMTIGSFKSMPAQNDPDVADAETLPEPQVVDVNVWYEMIGENILDTVITELNSNGHTKLTIKENGDIVINRNKKETVQATLDAFPDKNYWNELISVLEENELKGRITGDHLQISWI